MNASNPWASPAEASEPVAEKIRKKADGVMSRIANGTPEGRTVGIAAGRSPFLHDAQAEQAGEMAGAVQVIAV